VPENTEKNVQNYRRDKINEIAERLVIEHLSPDNVEHSSVYEDDEVIDLQEEFDDDDIWQDVHAEVVSVLDVLLNRYLDDEPIDLTLSNRLNEEK